MSKKPVESPLYVLYEKASVTESSLPIFKLADVSIKTQFVCLSERNTTITDLADSEIESWYWVITKPPTIMHYFPEILKSTTVGVRCKERVLTQVPTALSSVSAPARGMWWIGGGDMHKGGQEQLIFKVCQPTLLGYLVNGTVEDLNLQTLQHC